MNTIQTWGIRSTQSLTTAVHVFLPKVYMTSVLTSTYAGIDFFSDEEIGMGNLWKFWIQRFYVLWFVLESQIKIKGYLFWFLRGGKGVGKNNYYYYYYYYYIIQYFNRLWYLMLYKYIELKYTVNWFICFFYIFFFPYVVTCHFHSFTSGWKCSYNDKTMKKKKKFSMFSWENWKAKKKT